jgi:hypothetical protein
MVASVAATRTRPAGDVALPLYDECSVRNDKSESVTPMRLKDKIAIVVGAGQSPGEGMGNGRATVLRFVQEGATVMAVDRDLALAEETVAMARQHGPCVAFEADVTRRKCSRP